MRNTAGNSTPFSVYRASSELMYFGDFAPPDPGENIEGNLRFFCSDSFGFRIAEDVEKKSRIDKISDLKGTLQIRGFLKRRESEPENFRCVIGTIQSYSRRRASCVRGSGPRLPAAVTVSESD